MEVVGKDAAVARSWRAADPERPSAGAGPAPALGTALATVWSMAPEPGLGEGLEWERPSARLRTLRRTEVAAATGLAMLAAIGAGVGSGAPMAGWIGALAALVCGALAHVGLARRVRAWGFAERDEDLLVRRGVMFRRLSVIPYGRMQYVDVTAGPFERAFGLASVRMHTAAAASDARIPGLEAEDAAKLRDRLSTLGESQAAGL